MSTSASTSRPRQVNGVVIASSPPAAAAGDDHPAGSQNRRPWRLLLRCVHVVAAAGALHTPALLLRSGVTVAGNVGANLRMHPATVVTATFPKARLFWSELILITLLMHTDLRGAVLMVPKRKNQ